MRDNSFTRRLGSIASLLLALASAVVLAGSAAPTAASGVLAARAASPVLRVDVTHLPEPAKGFDIVAYHVTVWNDGDAIASNVSVKIDAPPGEFVGGPCQPPTPPSTSVFCTLNQPIYPNQSAALTYSQRIYPAGEGDLVPVPVTVTASASGSPDAVGTDLVHVSPRQEDLTVGINATPNPALLGQELTIRAVVTDAGPDSAYSPPSGDGIVLTITLPPMLEIISFSPPSGVTPPFCLNNYASNGSFLCKFPSVNLDQSVAAEIKLKSPDQQTVSANATVTANHYAADPDPSNNSATVDAVVLRGFPLTVTKEGNGSGSVSSSPGGINCGTNCSANYASGTQVTLTEQPAGGTEFAGWGGACGGSSITCTVTVDQTQSVTARFNAITTPPPPPPPPPPGPPPPPPPPPPPGPPPPPPPPPPSPDPEFCVVPDVVGLKETRAKTAITKGHCKVGRISRKYSKKRAKGRVLAQNPTSAFLLDVGSRINLTVSKGRKPAPKRRGHH